MATLSSCCQAEADRHLKQHRDVARCEICGSLLLAYGDNADYEKTLAELSRAGISPATGRAGTLLVVAKPRRAPRQAGG